jgi:CheY-like chemotaxis protein
MPTILCIDDEPIPTELRCELLNRSGYNVIVAGSAKEGIKVFATQPIDLVVLDYWMDGMDGLDVATELKRINRKLPIVMLSGYSSILDEGLGLVDRWLLKGQSKPHDLLNTIKELLSCSK